MNGNRPLLLILVLLLLAGCYNQGPASKGSSPAPKATTAAPQSPPPISGDSCVALLADQLQKRGLLKERDLLLLDRYDSAGGYYAIGQGVNTPDRVEFHTWWQYYPESGIVVNAQTMEPLQH